VHARGAGACGVAASLRRRCRQCASRCVAPGGGVPAPHCSARSTQVIAGTQLAAPNASRRRGRAAPTRTHHAHAGLRPHGDVCGQLRGGAQRLRAARHQRARHALHRAAAGERARCARVWART
jgi:hypothetical protein